MFGQIRLRQPKEESLEEKVTKKSRDLIGKVVGFAKKLFYDPRKEAEKVRRNSYNLLRELEILYLGIRYFNGDVGFEKVIDVRREYALEKLSIEEYLSHALRLHEEILSLERKLESLEGEEKVKIERDIKMVKRVMKDYVQQVDRAVERAKTYLLYSPPYINPTHTAYMVKTPEGKYVKVRDVLPLFEEMKREYGLGMNHTTTVSPPRYERTRKLFRFKRRK